jgi:sec-independent protein translocase protein TatC
MALDQVDVDTYEVKRSDDMNFWEHIEELRKRIIRAALAIMVGVIFIFALGDWFFHMVVFAPLDKNFVTYGFMCKLGEKLNISTICIPPPNLKIVTILLGETFFKQMQVSMIVGFLLAIPFVFWQVWLFIKPGLMEAEIKASRGFVSICSLLFISGVLFGYFIITPFAVSFLANFTLQGVEGRIGGQASLDDYVGYLTMFTLPIGLVFELPVVIYFLSKIGIVTPKFLRQYRKHMVVVLLIVAGIITPSPDLVSQLLVGIPLILLYEASIVVSGRVQKARLARQAEFEKVS